MCDHPACEAFFRDRRETPQYIYESTNMWVSKTLGHRVPASLEYKINEILSKPLCHCVTVSCPTGMSPFDIVTRLHLMWVGRTYMVTLEQDIKGRWHVHGIIAIARGMMVIKDMNIMSQDYGLGFLKLSKKPGPGWLNYMFKDWDRNRFVMTNKDISMLRNIPIFKWTKPDSVSDTSYAPDSERILVEGLCDEE